MLCRMRLHIERLTSTLEQESKKCEILYFKLLSHFYYGKTVEEACNLVETNYKQGFFEEVISFHCDCLDKSFIMEIALHFEQWFSKCVPYFIDTVMLHESERLRTYLSDEWPHDREIFSVGKLAKSGLYYIGTSDNVKCALCDLILHRWEPDDDPIFDHFKYKPRCPLLRNHETSMNVSDVGKQSDLQELMSVLKSETEEEEDGFDEVDHRT